MTHEESKNNLVKSHKNAINSPQARPLSIRDFHMNIAFIDDAETHDRYWFGLGGFVMPGANLLDLEHDFVRALKNVNVPVEDKKVDTEVKWSPGRSNWFRRNLVGDERRKLYTKLLEISIRHGGVFLSSLFYNKGITIWRHGEYRDQAYIYLLERIEQYAATSGEPMIVICDMENDFKKSRERISKCLNLIQNGSEYLDFNYIYRHPWAVDSKHHAGSQIADLIAGITVNIAGNQMDYAGQYKEILRGKFMNLKEVSARTPQRYGVSVIPSQERSDVIRRLHPYL